jgi:transcriptional regulator with XRE-family HTH domain
MKQRLQQILSKEQLTPVRFAELVGVQRSSVSHILSGRNNPSLDFIQKILLTFPQISSDWLINGIGEIYRDHASGKQIRTPELFGQANEEVKVPYQTMDRPESPESMPPSEIDRIVVFYRDRTFSEYKPD